VEQVCGMLRGKYPHVEASADPAVTDAAIDRVKPQVLVLAFKSIEACERFYLGLYRRSECIHTQPHRTLLLCDKDGVRRAYELCLQDVFDDYVLYWPLVHDAMRLAMSVHLALCALEQEQALVPLAELSAVARRAEALVPTLEDVVRDAHPARDWVDTITSERAELLQAARNLAAHARHGRPLVLAVDDDQFMRRLLRQLLMGAKYDVKAVGSGFEAQSYLTQHCPHLILLDVDLPDGNGIGLVRELKASRSSANIPIIMLTGHTERQVIVDSQQAGAVDFLAKPFERDILLRKVAHHLGR
jgi:CheY-like chemotaxis protein